MLSGFEAIHFSNHVTTTQVQFASSATSFPGVPLLHFGSKFGTQLASQLAKWDQAFSEVRKLGLLRDNWDGYGGCAVTTAAVNNLVQAFSVMSGSDPAIPVPEVSPTSSGTISLTWEDASIDAVLEFGVTRYSGYVQIPNQPVIYLDGSAAAFGPDDCAILAASLKGTSNGGTINRVSIGADQFEYRMAA